MSTSSIRPWSRSKPTTVCWATARCVRLGPFYLPAFGPGARVGIAELAPHLIGCDPTELGTVNDIMDKALLGHAYAKSAIDMACWDLLGKRAGMPVCDLMGGRQGGDVALYRAISQEAPEQMAAKIAGYRDEGYTKFQLKVGGDPDDDIERIHAARRCSTKERC